MSPWELASLTLVLALAGCGWLCSRGDALERLSALELASVIAISLLSCIAAVGDRATYLDVAIVTGALSYAMALVFARVLERWL